jgi:hypothetical protein
LERLYLKSNWRSMLARHNEAATGFAVVAERWGRVARAGRAPKAWAAEPMVHLVDPRAATNGLADTLPSGPGWCRVVWLLDSWAHADRKGTGPGEGCEDAAQRKGLGGPFFSQATADD